MGPLFVSKDYTLPDHSKAGTHPALVMMLEHTDTFALRSVRLLHPEERKIHGNHL